MDALLASLDPRPQHVIVRLSLEREDKKATAVAQLRAAVACGATVGGYLWLYSSRDPRLDVRAAIELAARANVTLPVLWLDVEPYNTDNSLPTVWQITSALAECEAQGVIGGIYTGQWVWPRLGDTKAFANSPLWVANYNASAPTLDFVPFGGWTQAAGHQYTSHPLDRSVFDPRYT